MKPIPPVDICKYFWTGEGVPGVTAGIPVGAVYIDKTSGTHYVRNATTWVVQTFSATISDGLREATTAGLAILALETPAATGPLVVSDVGVPEVIDGTDFPNAAVTQITVVSGVVTAAS